MLEGNNCMPTIIESKHRKREESKTSIDRNNKKTVLLTVRG
jgi:hypothetical protein